MTKREPQGEGGARGSGAPGDPEQPEHPEQPGQPGQPGPPETPDDSAGSLLDRWQAHRDDTAPAATEGDAPPHDEPVPTVKAPVEEPDAEPDAEPVAATTPVRDEVPSLPREATVSLLDDARARRSGSGEVGAPSVEPTPLRALQPEPDPEPDQLANQLADPEPTPETSAADAARAVRRAINDGGRPKHAAPRRPAMPTDRATDSVVASREIMDALGLAAGDGNAESSPAPKHAAVGDTPGDTSGDAQAFPVTRGKRVREARTSEDSESSRPPGPEVGRSLNVEFPAKTGAREVIGLLLLISFAATCGAAYVAYDDQRTLTLGVAGTLLVVTLVLYAVRAASTPTLVAIRSGQLVVTRGNVVEKFDLTSRFTRIEVVGTPGRPGWKVLCGRFGRDPLVINSSVVDPKEFCAELERYRPRP